MPGIIIDCNAALYTSSYYPSTPFFSLSCSATRGGEEDQEQLILTSDGKVLRKAVTLTTMQKHDAAPSTGEPFRMPRIQPLIPEHPPHHQPSYRILVPGPAPSHVVRLADGVQVDPEKEPGSFPL